MGSAVSGQRKNHKSTGDLRADAPPAAVHGSSTAPAASRSLSGVVVEDSPTARGDRRKESFDANAQKRVQRAASGGAKPALAIETRGLGASLCSPTLPRKSGEWSDDSPVRRASRDRSPTGRASRDRSPTGRAGKRSVESRIDRFDASDSLLRHYCACVAECLFHLHARGIVYRDLKPENLMVARNGYLKLVDFGFAKRLPYYRSDADEAELTAHFKTYTMCGTAEYISPEIINGSGHDWSADVWAAGCLFHELLVGSTPFGEFPGETTDQALIFKRAVTSQYKPFMPPFALVKRKHAAALVNAMLKFDPSERFAASAVLAHGYFAPTDWPRLRTQDDEPEWTPPPRGAGFYKDKLCARPAEPYDDAKDPGAFAVFH